MKLCVFSVPLFGAISKINAENASVSAVRHVSVPLFGAISEIKILRLCSGDEVSVPLFGAISEIRLQLLKVG